MLSKSNDTTIHVKNIQNLMIGFYKHLYGLPDAIMKGFFFKKSLNITFKVVE